MAMRGMAEAKATPEYEQHPGSIRLEHAVWLAECVRTSAGPTQPTARRPGRATEGPINDFFGFHHRQF